MLQKYNNLSQLKPLADLLGEPNRLSRFSRRHQDLLLDFSRVRVDEDAMEALLSLAVKSGVEERRESLFRGDNVNNTEQRPALHMGIRDIALLAAYDAEETRRVVRAQEQMLDLAEEFFHGRLPGAANTRVRHIVHVGIGGSLLGTRLVCEALDAGESEVQVHFLGSVDAHVREQLMQRLDPQETVVILVSKSFTTGDTLLHGQRLRDWLRAALGDAGVAHLFAVTSQTEKAARFGIDPSRMLYFPEFVGGRYSLWTPVSLAAAAVAGPRAFQRLLDGAADMDRHFRETPLQDNLPVLFALIGVWHRNVCGFPAWGVMPYDQRLRLLPAFLQQLVMESNGKSVTRGGTRVDWATAPVVFGETGTEAQHSVFQALHQGTDVVPLNFVGVIRPAHADREAHDELLANLLAQVTALAVGRSADATRSELGDCDEALLAHRTFDGNRPSELLLLDELTPESLGRMLALYEHKVFVESVLWDINAFDQWGVELGKTLAPGIQAALAGESPPPDGLADLLEAIAERR